MIEAQFKVQLRLADYHFEQAQTLDDVHTHHAAFVDTFNTTAHWAHRQRPDDAHTPVDVLGEHTGRIVEPQRLHQLFGRTEFMRTVNRYGFVSIQRFYLYAEQGLACHRVAIWIEAGHLRIAYHQTVVAQYQCDYDRLRGRLQDVRAPVFYATPFASTQLELLELDDTQWCKCLRRALRTAHRRRAMLPAQLSLLDGGT